HRDGATMIIDWRTCRRDLVALALGVAGFALGVSIAEAAPTPLLAEDSKVLAAIGPPARPAGPAEEKKGQGSQAPAPAATSPDALLLKDFRPNSIYKIQRSQVDRARFPVIDVHSHVYARTPARVDEWVRTMDEVG